MASLSRPHPCCHHRGQSRPALPSALLLSMFSSARRCGRGMSDEDEDTDRGLVCRSEEEAYDNLEEEDGQYRAVLEEERRGVVACG